MSDLQILLSRINTNILNSIHDEIADITQNDNQLSDYENDQLTALWDGIEIIKNFQDGTN